MNGLSKFSMLALFGCWTTMALLVGCGGSGAGGDTAHWQGEVTIDGQPLPAGTQGSITFRPEGAQAKPITVQVVDGKYDSPQTPKGKITAYFDLNKPTGKTFTSERTGEVVEEMESIVPRENLQGVQLEVTEDKTDATIDL